MLCMEVNITDTVLLVTNNFWLFNTLEHKFYICFFSESGSACKCMCVC